MQIIVIQNTYVPYYYKKEEGISNINFIFIAVIGYETKTIYLQTKIWWPRTHEGRLLNLTWNDTRYWAAMNCMNEYLAKVQGSPKVNPVSFNQRQGCNNRFDCLKHSLEQLLSFRLTDWQERSMWKCLH